MNVGDTIRRVKNGTDFAPIGFTSVVENVNGRMHYKGLTGLTSQIVPEQWEVVAPEFRVEAGKMYLLSDGTIVGPMEAFYRSGKFIAEKGDGRVWDKTGKACGAEKHPDIQREFIDIPEGAFVKLTDGAEEGPVERVKCLKGTDLAGFFYRTPQNYNGYFTNGQSIHNETGPLGIASVVPVLTLELGKYYQTRNGRIIGPAKKAYGVLQFEFEGPWNHTHDVSGTYWGDDPGLNIVKEVRNPPNTPALKALDITKVTLSTLDIAKLTVAPNWADVKQTGAVETTAKTVTEKKIVPGRYGPTNRLIVGAIGTSGERVALKLENRFYSKADIAEIVSILNGIADALPEART